MGRFGNYAIHNLLIKDDLWGAPVVAQGVKNWHGVCDDVGSIPGFARFVKYLALPHAAV